MIPLHSSRSYSRAGRLFRELLPQLAGITTRVKNGEDLHDVVCLAEVDRVGKALAQRAANGASTTGKTAGRSAARVSAASTSARRSSPRRRVRCRTRRSRRAGQPPRPRETERRASHAPADSLAHVLPEVSRQAVSLGLRQNGREAHRRGTWARPESHRAPEPKPRQGAGGAPLDSFARSPFVGPGTRTNPSTQDRCLPDPSRGRTVRDLVPSPSGRCA